MAKLAPPKCVPHNLQFIQEMSVKIPGIREVILGSGPEMLATGQIRGSKFESIIAAPLETAQGSNRIWENIIDKMAADTRPTAKRVMLRDHSNRRRTGADVIYDRGVDESRRLGLAAPGDDRIEINQRISIY